MIPLDRIFVIRSENMEKTISNPTLLSECEKNHLLLFIEGKERKLRGFMSCPQTLEEVNEIIEALKQFKISLLYPQKNL